MYAHRNFGFVLNDVRRRFVERFEQRAGEFSLTLPQCRVLATLYRNEGASQSKLAQIADVEPMSMVRILDHMEKEGWLERRVDPHDRRARRLFLTDNAKPLLEQIWRLSDLTSTEAFAGIGRGERAAFVAVLERIQANLGAIQGAPVDEVATRRLSVTAPRGKTAHRMKNGP